jgi:hypothetical protein
MGILFTSELSGGGGGEERGALFSAEFFITALPFNYSNYNANVYFSHSQALKMYMRARDHCTSSKHIVQLCLNIIKVGDMFLAAYTVLSRK